MACLGLRVSWGAVVQSPLRLLQGAMRAQDRWAGSWGWLDLQGTGSVAGWVSFGRGSVGVWLVVARAVLQWMQRQGQKLLRLQLDATRAHNRWLGGGESGSVGPKGSGSVAGWVSRVRQSEEVWLMMVRIELKLGVWIPARVVEVLVW